MLSLIRQCDEIKCNHLSKMLRDNVIHRDNIELNTKFRTLAKNDFEKNLFMLMNNAVFIKTMKNVRNHINVKLLTQWDGQ